MGHGGLKGQRSDSLSSSCLLVGEALHQDSHHLSLVHRPILVRVEVVKDGIKVVDVGEALDLSEVVLGSVVEGAELALLEHAVVVGVKSGPKSVNLLLSFLLGHSISLFNFNYNPKI